MCHSTADTRAPRLLILLAICGAGTASAQVVLAPSFQQEIVISGRQNPTAVRFAPNGQIFVAEKNGQIWVYDGVGDATPTRVIDLRRKVHNYWDRGLLGLAVAPGYPATPHLYVLYAHDVYPDGSGPRWDTAVPGPSTDDPCPTPPGPTADGCVVFGQLSRIVIDMQTMQGAETALIGADSALPATRWVWCQQYPSHSTGDLAFGPDGYLYASAGDGASFNFADWGQDGNPLNPCDDPPAGDGNLTNGTGTSNTGNSAAGGALRSQDILTSADPTSYDGAILRIDVSTTPVQAPADNPLVGNAVADDDFIIAVGLRNPFRISRRPGTGEIWVADVGWNVWEEINRIVDPAGDIENFGWPCYEGGDSGNLVHTSYDQQTQCQILYNNLPAGIVRTAPYWAYRHADQVVSGELCGMGGSAVTGLAFNTATVYPNRYDNALFFADSARRCIWTMFAGSGGLPDKNDRLALVSRADGRIVDIQMGPDGRLYYVDFDFGRVYRINWFGVNVPPVAVVTADVTNGPAPLAVTLDGSASSDTEDGTNLLYSWELDGDGLFDDAAGPVTNWTFPVGVHSAELRVEDGDGGVDTAAITITSGNTAPVPVIFSPLASDPWAVGDELTLVGQATDDQDGMLPPEQLSWTMLMHHCYSLDDCHTHELTTVNGVDTTPFVAPDHEFPAYLEIRLTAQDFPPDSLSATTSLLLFPRTTVLTLASDPPGLQLTLGAETHAAPFDSTVIVNSAQGVDAPAPQQLNSTWYEFAVWSDGGEPSHLVTAPDGDATLTATFVPEPDSDGDGLVDHLDNCTNVANPTQLDADGDGYGNICDADLNNSGLVTAADYEILRDALNTADPVADLNGSGLVTVADYSRLRDMLNKAPGPSGLRP